MNPSFTLCRGLVLATALSAGLFANAGRSAIVINPDGTFDNPAPFTQTSEMTWQDRYPDGTVNSWFTRDESHSWSNANGQAVTGGTNNFIKLGQVFAVPLAASNETALQFSFDWKPGSGSTGNQLQMAYWLIGWKTNSTPSNTDIFWNYTNWNASVNNAGISNLNGNATVYSLDGTSVTGGVVTGVANVTSNYTATFGLPVSRLGDIDFIGIRLSAKGPAVTGHTLDNVILVAVPEPSSVALIGAGTLVAALARRRKPTA